MPTARIRITLTGDKALKANIRRLSRIYTPKLMDLDMEAAIEPLRRTTEKNALPLRNFRGKHSFFFPQPSGRPPGGHLDEGVVSARIVARPKRRTWWVSFARRARYIAHLVEFGTAPHRQDNFKGGFDHPGAKAQPFFRPAFDAEREHVLQTLARRAWLRLSAATSTVRRK